MNSDAVQGYLPSQLFNLDGSKYGTQQALEDLLLGVRIARFSQLV